ncbi:unnamed protein product [Amoebophrya sp. A25]|nr:unnamed protein product [Amoebophrya sp. A25]|eukprot:GSA25T00025246001.1
MPSSHLLNVQCCGKKRLVFDSALAELSTLRGEKIAASSARVTCRDFAKCECLQPCDSHDVDAWKVQGGRAVAFHYQRLGLPVAVLDRGEQETRAPRNDDERKQAPRSAAPDDTACRQGERTCIARSGAACALPFQRPTNAIASSSSATSFSSSSASASAFQDSHRDSNVRRSDNAGKYDQTFDRLYWAGLELVRLPNTSEPTSSGHSQRSTSSCRAASAGAHLGEPLRGLTLVSFSQAWWDQYEAILGDLARRARARVGEAKKYAATQEGKACYAKATRSQRVNWDALGWHFEFLAEEMGLPVFSSAVVMFVHETNEVRSVFLPFPDVPEVSCRSGAGVTKTGAASSSPTMGILLREGAVGAYSSMRMSNYTAPRGPGQASTITAIPTAPQRYARTAHGSSFGDKISEMARGCEAFAQSVWPAGSNARGYSLIGACTRGHKAAEGPMLMCGTKAAAGLGLIHGKDFNGNPVKIGDVYPYNANKPRDEQLDEIAAAYATRFAKLESAAVPRGAESRYAIMQTLDPSGRTACVGGKGKHREYNGTHNLTKTFSYAVMCHADSSADGTLETIAFYKPLRDPFERHSTQKREELPPVGHGWFFVAGGIFDMPREPGRGCLVWVASCNPRPLFHGTLPSYTGGATDRRHYLHSGIGSALLCQRNLVKSLALSLAGESLRGGGLNNVKAKKGKVEIFACPFCRSFCLGNCEQRTQQGASMTRSAGLRADSGAAASSSSSATSSNSRGPSVRARELNGSAAASAVTSSQKHNTNLSLPKSENMQQPKQRQADSRLEGAGVSSTSSSVPLANASANTSRQEECRPLTDLEIGKLTPQEALDYDKRLMAWVITQSATSEDALVNDESKGKQVLVGQQKARGARSREFGVGDIRNPNPYRRHSNFALDYIDSSQDLDDVIRRLSSTADVHRHHATEQQEQEAKLALHNKDYMTHSTTTTTTTTAASREKQDAQVVAGLGARLPGATYSESQDSEVQRALHLSKREEEERREQVENEKRVAALEMQDVLEASRRTAQREEEERRKWDADLEKALSRSLRGEFAPMPDEEWVFDVDDEDVEAMDEDDENAALSGETSEILLDVEERRNPKRHQPSIPADDAPRQKYPKLDSTIQQVVASLSPSRSAPRPLLPIKESGRGAPSNGSCDDIIVLDTDSQEQQQIVTDILDRVNVESSTAAVAEEKKNSSGCTSTSHNDSVSSRVKDPVGPFAAASLSAAGNHQGGAHLPVPRTIDRTRKIASGSAATTFGDAESRYPESTNRPPDATETRIVEGPATDEQDQEDAELKRALKLSLIAAARQTPETDVPDEEEQIRLLLERSMREK